MKSLILRILPLLALTSSSGQIVASNSMAKKLVTSVGMPTKSAVTYATVLAGACAINAAYNLYQTNKSIKQKSPSTGWAVLHTTKAFISATAAATIYFGSWFSPTIAATSLAASAADIIAGSWFDNKKIVQAEQIARTVIAAPILFGAFKFFRN
jgi:hypothetical protein